MPAFQNVLKFMDLRDLLEFRYVSADMADGIVPSIIPNVKYQCPEEQDETDYSVLKHIKHARKVEIKNICGTEAHLRKIEEIGKRQIGKIEYLYLEFDDDDST